jgi:hypothetical protein
MLLMRSGCRATPAIGLHNGIETVARIQLLNLISELELLEDAARGVREAVNVGNNIQCDVLAVASSLWKVKGWCCKEAVCAPHRRFSSRDAVWPSQAYEPLVFLEHGVSGRLKHAVALTQHHYGQHDQSILRRAIRPL